MSRSIDLFIRAERGPESLLATLGAVADAELYPTGQPGTWGLDCAGVHAELWEHRYLEDGELALSRYPFALSCRVADDRRLADAPETIFLRLVSEALQKEDVATLLVHDLQYRDRPAASPPVASVAEAVTGPFPAEGGGEGPGQALPAAGAGDQAGANGR